MDKHPHPGEKLRKAVIIKPNLSVTEVADRLGMSRVALSRVLNGHAAVSLDLALRLEKAGVGNALTWMVLQANYDIAQAKLDPQIPIRAIWLN